MPATPTLLDSVSANSGGTSVASNSVSPSGNALLIVLMGGAGSSGDPTPLSIADTLSGGSLTWTKAQELAAGAANVIGVFWAITGATPGSGVITVSMDVSVRRALQVIQIASDFDSTTPIRQSKQGSNQLSSLTLALDSSPLADSVVVAGIVSRGDLDVTPGATYTELSETVVGTTFSLQSQYDQDSAANPNWSGLGTTDNIAVALEVQEPAAGGPDYTLALDAGSYTVTGQTVGLKAARRLTAGGGSYSLTGQAASLLVNRLLAAASGTYTLTGRDVTLTYTPNSGPDYTLTAEAGSYTLSGQSVSLIVSRVLVADSGAYTLTGQAANLLVGRLLAASQGSYSLSGQDASLTVSRLLTAGAGNYSLTGRTVTLVYSGEEAAITPASRVYVIPAEDRVFVIVAEDRTFAIGTDNRVSAI